MRCRLGLRDSRRNLAYSENPRFGGDFFGPKSGLRLHNSPRHLSLIMCPVRIQQGFYQCPVLV